MLFHAKKLCSLFNIPFPLVYIYNQTSMSHGNKYNKSQKSGLQMTNHNTKNMTSQPHTSVSQMCVLYNHHLCVHACARATATKACINYITSCKRYHKISPFKDTAQCCNSYCRTRNILHNLSLLPPPITAIYNKTDKVFYYIPFFFTYT